MFYDIVIGFFKTLYYIFFRPKVVGVENLPQGGFILAANHTSNLDPPFVVVFMPGKQMILAKKELFKNKLFGKFLSHLGAVPLNRGEGDVHAIKTALTHLKNGGNLLLFPQGGRRKEINLDDAKNGLALLATRAKVPIVPIGISGDYKLFRRMYLNIGAPMCFDQFYGKKLTSEELNKISRSVVKKIITLAGT